MSIICAIKINGQTWIGSDTACRRDDEVFESSPKWVVNGKWAVGVSGDMRVQALIEADYETLLTGSPLEIGNNIRKAMLDDGFEAARDKNDKGFQHFGQYLILASNEAIYGLSGDLSPALRRQEFVADGSGWELAKGAYFAARKMGVNRADRILELAISAAIEEDLSCGGQVWLHCLGDSHGT